MEYDISNKHMFVANYKLVHINVFVSFFISHYFFKIHPLVNCCRKYMCIHCVRSMPTDYYSYRTFNGKFSHVMTITCICNITYLILGLVIFENTS